MAKKNKAIVNMIRGVSKKSDKPYYASDDLSLERLMNEVKGTIQFTVEAVENEQFKLDVQESWGDRSEEVSLTKDKTSSFFSLWHREGTSKGGDDYSFYSTGNIPLLQIREHLGDSIRLFIGKTNSENPKAAPFYICFAKSLPKRQGQQKDTSDQASPAEEEAVF